MSQVLRQVGRYEIVREVGRGGMAVVYLARQTDLDRDVALKELSAFYAGDGSFAERFIRESRVAGSLSHPNIVTVHDFFEHDRVPYISMEYLERGSLRPLIGQLTLPQAAGVLEGLLAGLAHAAKRGVVHRDLKPENLMITAEGTIKIADFGIAKALNDVTSRLTATGTAIGTPAYMAPEQVTGTGVTASTDLYATGVIAFELLTGQVPFDHDESLALLFRHVNEPPPDPRTITSDLDPQVARWVMRLLAKNPAERPRSPAEAWDTLEEIVIHTCGARWRRDSRLLDGGGPTALQPKTPEPAMFPQTTPAAPATKAATTPRPIEAVPQPAPSTVQGAPPVAVPAPAVRDRRRLYWSAGIAGALAVVAGAVAAVFLAGGGGGGGSKPPPIADVKPPSSQQFAVAVARGRVFATTPSGRIVRLSSKLGSQGSFQLAGHPVGLATSNRGQWLYVLDQNAIFQLSAKLQPVAESVAFSEPVAIAAGGSAGLAVAAVRGSAGRGALCLVGLACRQLSFVPTGVGVDAAGIVYVSNTGGRVFRFALKRSKLAAAGRRLSLGAAVGPQGTFVAGDGGIYVPVRRGVVFVDTGTGKTRRIHLPTTPVSLARLPDGRLAAALYAANAVALIQPGTGARRLIGTVKRPVALAVSGSGRLYVVSGSGAVAVLDGLGKVVGRGNVAARAAVPAVFARPVISESGQTVRVRLPIRSGAIDSRSIIVRGRKLGLSISRGQASFAIVRSALNLGSAAQRTARAGLTVHVALRPGEAIVTLTAASGAFVSMSRPVVRARAIAFTLTKKPVTPAGGGTTSGGTTSGGTTSGGSTSGGSTSGGSTTGPCLEKCP